MTYTNEQIKQKYDLLPQEVRNIIDSAETTKKIVAIADKYNLLVDKMGELVEEITLILLGLEKSSDFVNHISQKLGISTKAALLIAQDVNSEIFDSIKDSIKKIEDEVIAENSEYQEDRERTVADIEQAGNFRVEKEVPEQNNNRVTSADRAKILAGVEDPQTSTSETSNFSTPFGSFPRSESKPSQENYTEPLVDYLLANPIAQSEKKVTVETKDTIKGTVPQVKTAPTTPVVPRKQGPDPYREAVK